MAKDINLNSKEWIDLVFEGKNQSYGAYKMRKTSTKRHLIAFGLIILFVIFMAFLPLLIKTVKSLTARDRMTEVTALSNLKMEEQKLKPEDKIEVPKAPPPPPLKSTQKFTPPVIADAEEVTAEDEMKTQDELNDSKTTISIKDIVGTDEEHGVDIADLQEHKVAIEEKPLDVVEQMPSFPGGEAALAEFLKKNLHYPQSALDMGIYGRVSIKFVVGKTGEVSNIIVARGVDPACDKEALRVVSIMPKWIPGRQSGRSVAVWYTLPVYFKMGEAE